MEDSDARPGKHVASTSAIRYPPSQRPKPSPHLHTDIANHVAAHYRMMAHWDALLPGRVLHLHYADMVRDQEVGGWGCMGEVSE